MGFRRKVAWNVVCKVITKGKNVKTLACCGLLPIAETTGDHRGVREDAAAGADEAGLVQEAPKTKNTVCPPRPPPIADAHVKTLKDAAHILYPGMVLMGTMPASSRRL